MAAETRKDVVEQLQSKVRSSHRSCQGRGQIFLLKTGWRMFGRRDAGNLDVGIGRHVADYFLD